jgi:PleD family two-component response regulator
MPETNLDRAREVAARLRAAVSQASLAARSPDPIEVSMGLTAWRPGQDWQAAYEVVDGELYEDKRRRKEAKRLAPKEDKPSTPIRILGRSSGRRRLAGG